MRTEKTRQLNEIEENSIEIELYSIDNGLDQILSEMLYLRHNNPEAFKNYLINVKEISAKAATLAQRVKLLNECLEREE